jgi:hypothetical protein
MPWHAFAPLLLLLLLLLPLPLPLPHPRYLLVYVDHFTKWSRAWALKTKKREYAKKKGLSKPASGGTHQHYLHV